MRATFHPSIGEPSTLMSNIAILASAVRNSGEATISCVSPTMGATAAGCASFSPLSNLESCGSHAVVSGGEAAVPTGGWGPAPQQGRSKGHQSSSMYRTATAWVCILQVYTDGTPRQR